MSGGNGIDIGSVYQLLSEVARTVAGHDRKLDDIVDRLDGPDTKLDTIVDRLDSHDRKLNEIVGIVGEHTGKLDSHDRKLNEIIGVVNEHTGKLDQLADVVNKHDRKIDDLAIDIVGLRETLTHYHSSVLGHGIMLSELEDRVRRIERHLNLEPTAVA